ncbi:MAG: hypothetical protein ACRD0U_12580 [Acidimicrobiales bacterium]
MNGFRFDPARAFGDYHARLTPSGQCPYFVSHVGDPSVCTYCDGQRGAHSANALRDLGE